MKLMTFIEQLISEFLRFGKPRGLAFQKVNSLHYIKVFGVFQTVRASQKVIESRVFLPFILLSVIEQTHHHLPKWRQSAFVDHSTPVLSWETDALGISKHQGRRRICLKEIVNFTRLGCFSNLVIFFSALIDLIYFGFFLNNHYFVELCVCFL